MSGPYYSYSDGTITLTKGDATVTGSGTAWLTQVKPGDMLFAYVADDSSPEQTNMLPVGLVLSVTSNIEIELQRAFDGSSNSGLSYTTERGIAWLSGAVANETLITFLTEIGVLGLIGSSSSAGAPLDSEGRENEIRVDGNLIAYQKRGGTWVALTSPTRFNAVGSHDSTPSDRNQYDDGQGDLAAYVGAGLTFFDSSSSDGEFYILVTPSDDDASPTVSAVWAGPFQSSGAAGPLAADVTTDTVAGTTYEVVIGDRGKVKRSTNGSAVAVTLPNDMPEGFSILWRQSGAGQVTFSAASGATLHNVSDHTKTAGQWSEVSLTVDSNSDDESAAWVLSGATEE